jgi:ABC-2 type transport system permease protein
VQLRVLTKLMVTPTPRAALVSGKAFAAGVRSAVQATVVIALSTLLGVGWLQAISTCNPLSYEVDALRGLLIGTQARLGLDFAVLAAATVAGVTAAALLPPRLAR